MFIFSINHLGSKVYELGTQNLGTFTPLDKEDEKKFPK
jgi:hypothetical protein